MLRLTTYVTVLPQTRRRIWSATHATASTSSLTRSLREALRRLRDEHGKCIVFSTHIMQEVERLCDQVVVMAGGRTVATGTVPQLLARSGQTDFETCFVQLAFGDAAAALQATEWPT